MQKPLQRTESCCDMTKEASRSVQETWLFHICTTVHPKRKKAFCFSNDKNVGK